LVSFGVNRGKAGDRVASRLALDKAIALSPHRHEAWTERGGLSFLEGDYEGASSDLQRSLSLGAGDYSRELLATSLLLGGRQLEALAEWNRLGQPILRALSVRGRDRTRSSLLRWAIRPREGEALVLSKVLETQWRLRELRVLRTTSVTISPLGDGLADMALVIDERPRFGARRLDLVMGLALDALYHQVGLQVYNLAGTGAVIGSRYRWDEHRPLAAINLEIPDAFGSGLGLRLEGFNGQQDYELPEPVRARTRGGAFQLRRVVGPQTTLEAGMRVSNRGFSSQIEYAPPGKLVEFGGGFVRRVLGNSRQQLDLALHAKASAPEWGSTLSYLRGDFRMAYALRSPGSQRTATPRAEIAGQCFLGWGSRNLPLDEMYTPGASMEMDLPLRGHAAAPSGIVGLTPFGRSVILTNLEVRRRLFDTLLLSVGGVAFLDVATVGGRPDASPVTLVDGGFGLRLTLKGGRVLRLDWGVGLNDRTRAF
jgi:hypothetical protein